MMVAKAGIQRTGNIPPNDAAIIAMFDNALPLAYSQIRQLVRRVGHATFLAHFNDYMGQVRAELAARKPHVAGFATFLPRPPDVPRGNPADEQSNDRDRSSRGNSSNLCLRCAKPGHVRPQCRKPKVTCKHCGADHSSKLCPKGPGGSRRDSLSDNARRLLDRDVKNAAGDSSSSDSNDDASAATPANGAPAPAAAVATAVVPAISAPSDDAHAYASALKTLGFGG